MSAENVDVSMKVEHLQIALSKQQELIDMLLKQTTAAASEQANTLQPPQQPAMTVQQSGVIDKSKKSSDLPLAETVRISSKGTVVKDVNRILHGPAEGSKPSAHATS